LEGGRREEKEPMNVQELCGAVSLREVSMRYCKATWEAWKRGKGLALSDVADPMLGGPQDAMKAGIFSILTPGGDVITLTKLSRVRLGQICDDDLRRLGSALGKDLVAIKARFDQLEEKPRMKALQRDVLHQEWVATFEENIANDTKHLSNNLSSVCSVVDTAISFVAQDELPVEDLADILDRVSDDPATMRLFALASRSSWLGRVVENGEWQGNSEFTWYRTIAKNVAVIDPYVAAPVLKMFATDLREGFIFDQAGT
jgi:hypothetical protein